MRYLKHTVFFFLAFMCWQQQPAHAQPGGPLDDFKNRKEAGIAALKNFPRPDTNRVNALIKIFTAGAFLKERQEVLPYRLEALAISHKLNYKKGLATCYNSAGNYYKSALNHQEALHHFDSTLYITANTTDPQLSALRARAFERIGTIWHEQGNYYMALDNFFEALKYEDYISLQDNIRVTLFITQVYTLLNNLEKATEYGKRNIALLDKDTVKRIDASVYFSLIDISLEKQDVQTANYYLDKIAPTLTDPKEVLISFGYYMKRGQVSYLQQKYADAYQYFQYAFQYAVAGNHIKSRSKALRYLSGAALKLGDQDAAKKYALENLALAEQIDTKSEKIDALINLSGYYKASGNNNKALELMEQATQLKDSVMAENNIKQINILGAIYDAEKQEKEISRLQHEKEVQAADVKHTALLNRLFIASIIILLIVGYLGYSNFKRGQQLAKNQQALQKQKIKELEKDKQLLAVDAMLKGQEEERSRIAKDLHDGLGSSLSGTRLSFVNMRENLTLSAGNALLFDKSLSMLDNTIGDLRKVAHNLMPEGLQKFGLYEILHDFCDSIQSGSSLNVVFQHFGEIRRLDNTAEIFIYRIIQELVNNVIKHAEATQVIVQVVTNSDNVVITVEDNGKGFDKTVLSHTRGAGMANIRYRMQYFNGTSDIVTAPGKGTSVNIDLKV